jgi:regulator of replication initiation timing
MENMKMILKCLSKYEEIHGICILLKSNESRLRLEFHYCIEELLVNLHKNSIANVFFVFTNASTTFYGLGNTATLLKKLFADIKNANQNIIQLTDANTFTIENEAVRQLYAYYNGFKPEEEDIIGSCNESWKHTVNQTYRLFDYVAGLNSHLTNETKATNCIRRVLKKLLTILAKMEYQIKEHKKKLEAQTVELEKFENELKEKEKLMTFVGEHLEKTELTYPVTVCNGTNCIEAMRKPNSDVTETYYKQICCFQCPVKGVTPNKMREAKLQECDIFDVNTNCKICKCSWQSHLHIWYSQKKVTGKLSSNYYKEDMGKLALQITAKRDYIQKIRKTIKELEESYKAAFDLCQPYYNFLSQHSIIITNSAFEEYVNLTIKERERTSDVGANQNNVEALHNFLADIEQEKRFSSIPCNTKITMSNYLESIRKLTDHKVLRKELQSFDYTFEPEIYELVRLPTSIK